MEPQSAMECTHTGPCHVDLSRAVCVTMQRAEARKYDVNMTWLFAELYPDFWCLYNPDRRTPEKIGTLEEIIEAYRNRAPVKKTREVPSKKPRLDTSKLTFNI